MKIIIRTVMALFMTATIALSVLSFTLNASMLAANVALEVAEVALDASKATLNKAKQLNKTHKAKATKKALKRAAKTVAAAAVPFAGAVIVAGISSYAYCENLDDTAEMEAILNDNEFVPMDLSECADGAKGDIVEMSGEFADEFETLTDVAVDWVTDLF